MSAGNYYVYITTNPGKTTLYTGVTNNIPLRLKRHYFNRGKPETFAGKYYCFKLIYFEHFSDIERAIMREKEIKNMTREKKNELIATKNPSWNFLSV